MTSTLLATARLILAFVLFSGCSGSPLSAGEPKFRLHTLDADSTYSACAAMDVNRDGKLDVVCGGWWFEAPTWKRHFLRDVEVIRGRFDDYSNLPLDVNGDGWLDLISANYRSQKMYWIEHPGKQLGTWKTHEIAKPGPMETARLEDVDGDGRIDILPNGTRFAAWWELDRSKVGVRWKRHELPAEIAGHGIGFGDIDGDGRKDIVAPSGWYQAPQDRRRGRWVRQAEFRLHRDCALPILVYDVDSDGDNDVVWSRGHKTGIYWLEQTASTENSATQRDWQFHVIDSSWSQGHALLLEDLDGDGRPELIAGKRYLGHDGKDPGEYDAMTICAYSFQKKHRTWRRNVISRGGSAGFGLDPKCVDLDGDGDLDLICPGRSGLFWLENLLNAKSSDVAAKLDVPTYADHTRLLVYEDSSGKQLPVKSHADWGRRRDHILSSMQQVMGPLPDSAQRVPLDIKIVNESKTEKYRRIKLTFAAEPGDRVPAYFLVPNGLTKPAPAMLCLHQTVRAGKDEAAGISGKKTMHYAHELANRGYVCVVPDHPSLGEYRYDFSKASHYQSGTMKAIWNNIRAVDLLESRPEVDWDRIGCIGHSLGGHNALFTAAFDLRIKVVISSCGFTAFGDDDLPSWTGERYMPRIRTKYGNDLAKLPFDFHEVVGALAPRPFFVNAPQGDRDFSVEGVKKVMHNVGGLYSLLNAEQHLRAEYPDSPHDFPDEVRALAYEWLDSKLR
jgi:dipeptidyl aminopeptidase/acylaminoacyl peptidase